ncbi:MAG: MraZ protein [Frankiales bacterium]|nr:MraZ protein [Frankiales bacterium]
MFLGTHTPKLDDKGRLFLPAKFREALAEGVVITKGQERCLYVFKAADFAEQAEKLQTAPITGQAARDYSRVFFSSASDDVPDAQGRIRVPAPLRTYAGLSKECTVIGMNTRLEIWDSAAWTAYEAEKEQTFSTQSEEVLPGVF